MTTYQSLRIQADDLKAQVTGLQIKLEETERLWIRAELAANRAQMSELPMSKSDEKQDREDRRGDVLHDREVDRVG